MSTSKSMAQRSATPVTQRCKQANGVTQGTLRAFLHCHTVSMVVAGDGMHSGVAHGARGVGHHACQCARCGDTCARGASRTGCLLPVRPERAELAALCTALTPRSAQGSKLANRANTNT